MNFTFLFKVRLHRLLFYLIKEREFMKKASIIVLQLFCLVVIPVTAAGATYTVTNTNDSGSESLRQAILDANANTGTDTIAFNINSGVQAIRPTSALPVITDPIIIDGSTQPGFSGTPLIVIDGTSITRFPPRKSMNKASIGNCSVAKNVVTTCINGVSLSNKVISQLQLRSALVTQ